MENREWCRALSKLVTSVLALLAFWNIITCPPVYAQKTEMDETIRDKDINVLDFAELPYPISEQTARMRPEGPVVIRAALDDSGKVSEARAISGNELLIADSIANVHKWRFRPNPEKAVVVVYDFVVVKGNCKVPSSLFLLQRPNLVTITACLPLTADGDRASQRASAQNDETTGAETEVVDFEEMHYPRLARQAKVDGVVVVRASLDEKGNVVEAQAVSGNDLLTADSLANLKRWRFRSKSKKTAIVVYSFRFPCGNLSYKSDYQHQFVLFPPNFVAVTETGMTIQ
jgi:outer membrane biosynthesis protein TonB